MTTAIDRFIDGSVFAMFAGLVAFTAQIPGIEGNVNAGLALAGALNFILFSALLYVLFIGRAPLGRDDCWPMTKKRVTLLGLSSMLSCRIGRS